jgi:hypothetical protein
VTPIVIISCGNKKHPVRARAGHLYTGSYHGACRRWALSVTTWDRLYIISSRYGLVPADEEIEPYEQRLGQPGAISVPEVRAQAERLGLLDTPIVFAGGKAYAEFLAAAGLNVVAPFTGPGMGIGRQLKALKEARGQMP